jgi:hypothetical protein
MDAKEMNHINCKYLRPNVLTCSLIEERGLIRKEKCILTRGYSECSTQKKFDTSSPSSSSSSSSSSNNKLDKTISQTSELEYWYIVIQSNGEPLKLISFVIDENPFEFISRENKNRLDWQVFKLINQLRITAEQYRKYKEFE